MRARAGRGCCPTFRTCAAIIRADGTSQSPAASHLNREEAHERALAPRVGGPGRGIPQEAGQPDRDLLTSGSRSTAVRGRRVPRLGPALPCPTLSRRGSARRSRRRPPREPTALPAAARAAREGGRRSRRREGTARRPVRTHSPAWCGRRGGPATPAAAARARLEGVTGAARGCRPGHSLPGGRRRRLWMLGPGGSWPWCTCLVIAGSGSWRRGGGSSSSRGGSSRGRPAAAAGSAGRRAAGFGRARRRRAVGRRAAAPSAGFAVTQSGTRVPRGDPGQQVRAQLASTLRQPGGTTAPGNSTIAAVDGPPLGERRGRRRRRPAPSARRSRVRVLLDRRRPPRLVDRATYQGEPAYVIASSSACGSWDSAARRPKRSSS